MLFARYIEQNYPLQPVPNRLDRAMCTPISHLDKPAMDCFGAGVRRGTTRWSSSSLKLYLITHARRLSSQSESWTLTRDSERSFHHLNCIYPRGELGTRHLNLPHDEVALAEEQILDFPSTSVVQSIASGTDRDIHGLVPCLIPAAETRGAVTLDIFVGTPPPRDFINVL